MDTPLVSVVTVAYNHAPYIREYFEGVLMQKTTFPFELLIHDDASTDGTADIIREYEARYPDIIKAIYQTKNTYSIDNRIMMKILFPLARGKYIAVCDGDDYWIDSLKLQKQVDFLEAHPDYSICGGRFWIKVDGDERLYDNPWKRKAMAKYPHGKTIGLHNIFDPYLLQTLTVCFHQEIVEEFFYEKDDTWYSIALNRGKGFIFPDYFGVYRIHPGGIWGGKSTREKLQINLIYTQEIYLRFGKKSKSIRKKYFNEIIWLCFIELTEDKHFFRSLIKMIRLIFSGGLDTFPYRTKVFIRLTLSYSKNRIKKVFCSKKDD